jgi:superfamily I DNA/RNA helicase
MAAKNKPNQPDTRIYSKIDGVKTVTILENSSEKSEAVSIGQHIENMVGGIGFYSIDFDKVDMGDEHMHRSFSDFAILFRTRQQGEIIAEVFQSAGIPCQIVSREDALHKKGLADLLAVLRVFEGIGSYLDFERSIKLMALGISEKAVASFTAWGIHNHWTFAQALENARRFPIKTLKKKVQQKLNELSVKLSQINEPVQALKIEKRLKFILENPEIPLSEAGRKRLETAFLNNRDTFQKVYTWKPEFLTKTDIESDTDVYNPNSEKVALLTMHAAKGLEFPVVFISGCENGFIPFQRTGGAAADVDEERRLFYVALTRARERLFLTYAQTRRLHGKRIPRQPSPFIKDIQKYLKKYQTPEISRARAEKEVQLKLF